MQLLFPGQFCVCAAQVERLDSRQIVGQHLDRRAAGNFAVIDAGQQVGDAEVLGAGLGQLAGARGIVRLYGGDAWVGYLPASPC